METLLRKFALGVAVLLAVFVLASCGSSSTTSTTTTTASNPIMIKSASGTDRSADGTWSACHGQQGGPDVGEDQVISGTSFTINEYSFTTTNGTCGGSKTTTASFGGTFSANGPVTAYWSDTTTSGATFSPLPPKISGGSLPVQPTASSLSYSITVSTGTGGPPVGTNGKNLAFIDDSGTTYKWWRSTNRPAACSDASGNDLCLSTQDAFSFGSIAAAAAANPLLIKSASGTDRPADGTWAECHFSSQLAVDEGNDQVISGTSSTIHSYTYSSTNSTCSTGKVTTLTIAGTLTLNAPAAAYWSDSTTTSLPPPAQSSGGPLPAYPTASSVKVTVTSSSDVNFAVGASLNFAAFIDDTGTPYKWWRSQGSPASPCTDSSSSQLCLSTLDPFSKQ